MRQGADGLGGVGRGALALGLCAALALVPGNVAAQIGALSAVSAAVAGGSSSDIFAGAPVMGENGLILADGWAATASITGVEWTGEVPGEFGAPVDWALAANNLTVGGVFGVADGRAMVGAALSVYSGLELTLGGQSLGDESGLGDASLFGKVRVAESSDGQTRAAAFARVGLPTGAEEVSNGAASFGGGLGVSSQLNDQTSVHGSLGFTVLGGDDGEDSSSSVDFTGAVVGRVSDNVWLSGEFLGASSDGHFVVNVGPAVRFLAGDGFYIDVGGVVKAAASDEALPIDYGVVIGGTYVPPIR